MLLELRNQIRNGKISAVDVLDELESRIQASEPELGAYLSSDLEQAKKDAHNVAKDTPFAGLPIGIKDAIAVENHPLSCASRMLEDFVSPYDATVIAKLRAAGAVPFGRMNMDEFAMGATGLNSAIKPTKNPRDFRYTSGGSSSGSAAAVAAATALATLGSDTGGSIRQPAGFVGIVGLKPSYGRCSRYGLTAFASSLEQIGPMTATVADAALLFDTIAGYDDKDQTSQNIPVEPTLAGIEQAKESGLQGLRIGVIEEHMGDGLDLAVKEATQTALKKLEELGATLVPISLPFSEYAIATYYTLACAEASANLARFDGIRYGKRSKTATDISEVYRKSRSEGFGKEVQRRILTGTFVLSSGHYDAWYQRARLVRAQISQDFAKAFQQCDLIAGPISPTTAFKVGEDTTDPLKLYLADCFTVPANLANLPGISLPAGVEQKADGAKLPIGLQFLAPAFHEKRLLHAAAAFEAQTPWQQQFAPPALSCSNS